VRKAIKSGRIQAETDGTIDIAKVDKQWDRNTDRAQQRKSERLQALSNDHFNAHPDEINWGHVGDLGHYAELLKQITDSAFNEGEHAE
jgi:hypothetical protein